MPHDNTARLLRRYREHLLKYAPTAPVEGMMRPDEYRMRSIEEQQLLYDRFFDPKHCRIEDDGFIWQRENNHPIGNMATIYLWFVDQEDDGKLIDIRHIFSPLTRALSREQWSIFLDVSIVCHVYWQWLPSIIKTFNSDTWTFHGCIGWNLYNQKVFPIEEFTSLNPEPKREWIGTYLLNVNTISLSQETKA